MEISKKMDKTCETMVFQHWTSGSRGQDSGEREKLRSTVAVGPFWESFQGLIREELIWPCLTVPLSRGAGTPWWL